MSGARDANSAFARALVDEWVRAGITDAVVAPGSRSTPIALACAERLRVHVLLDERSAGFYGLGIGKQSGRPAVLVCTSGTAATGFHAAVREADESLVPMLVCTADRPPELQQTGAPQAMDQQRLYGSAVRWFFDPGPPTDFEDAGRFWRSVASRAFAESIGERPGPVHLNLPFREPFLSRAPAVNVTGRADGAPWTEVGRALRRAGPDLVERLLDAVGSVERGLILAGQDPDVDPAAAARFEAATGWPVLADPLSGLRTVDTITTYDALVRAEDWADSHRPEAVVRLGRPLTSKALSLWLDESVSQVTIAPTPSFADPYRSAALTFGVDPTSLLDAASEQIHRGAHDWMAAWMVAEGRARAAIDQALDSAEVLTEGRIARDVIAAAPDGSTMLVGSSMPVRDVESFAAGRHGVTFRSNRGINGIDGLVSTAQGLAAGGGNPVIALIGDLGFLHDANGLLGSTGRDLDVTYVVVDNDGGGIFSFLPQAGHDRFEELFGTPHGIDLGDIARAHRIPVAVPTEPGEVAPAVAKAVGDGGIQMVHLRTDRHANVAAHEAVWGAVASVLQAG